LVRLGVGPVRVTVMDATPPRQRLVASRLAAPGGGERAPTAAFAPLDCRVTPAICLAGD
jgi:hypothetical protein